MITEQSMTTIQEALESKRKFVLDMLDKYHKTDYDSQELKEWASDLRKELDGIDAALAELAQRAKPDAQGEWQPLNGYIHFSLANGHLVICDARSIDGLPFPDDVAICRKRTAPVEVQLVQGDDMREALAMIDELLVLTHTPDDYWEDWQYALRDRIAARYEEMKAQRPAAEAGA